MNVTIPMAPGRRAIPALALCATLMLLVCGCHKAPSAADKTSAAAAGSKQEAGDAKGKGDAKEQDDAKDKGDEKDPGDDDKGKDKGEAGEGVALKPEEVEKMGIVTTEVKAIQRAPEAAGFGVVLPHETVAQAVAELRTAIAAEHQSRAALERTKRLAGTPGAMPAETQETAERQAMTDQATLELARQKLSSAFGQSPPWKSSDSSPELLALASGQSKLVRVTFPLAALGDSHPGSLRLAHIGALQTGKSWETHTLWRAPADTTVPGKSYFAILKDGDIGEGDHMLAWAPVGEAEEGVLIPAAAVVISAGKFWCYVEEKPGTFVRTEFDPGRPTGDGYFVKEGVSAGDKIVVAAAGQLLARESNPSTEAE